MALILVPALYADLLLRNGAECAYVGCSKATVGYQWHVEVYGRATHLVPIAQLVVSKVLRYIDNQVDFVLPYKVEGCLVFSAVLLVLVRPQHSRCRYAVLIEVAAGAVGRVNLQPALCQHMTGSEYIGFLPRVAG